MPLYMQADASGWFMVLAFLLDVGAANFIMYSFWLPEQYGTECRASAFAFTANIGRFAAAGFTFLVGAGIRHFQALGIPEALTALVFIVGILLLPFGVETKGKPCRRERRIIGRRLLGAPKVMEVVLV
jgi:hypothetical protein